jgi:hypothetical protein
MGLKMTKKIKEIVPFSDSERIPYMNERSHLYALCATNNFFVLMMGLVEGRPKYWIEDRLCGHFNANGWTHYGEKDAIYGSMVSKLSIVLLIESGELVGFKPKEAERIFQDVMHQMGTGDLPF